MRAAAFLYPWDVVGDPHAAERIAALGVGQVTLASAYHSTRALTPRHPAHRVVTARHAAVLYPPGDHWKGRTPAPYRQDWIPGDDPYGEAAAALAGAGLEVHSWVVLAHNYRLGEEHPDTSVVNAYGDRYPWAPCIARPEVRAYLVDLAAEAAVRPGTRGTELESLGWYGLAHLHAHDKTAGVALGGAAQYLMSLCFCTVCREGYEGLEPGDVRAALEPVFARGGDPGDSWADVGRLLGAGRAAASRRWRGRIAREVQEACVAAVRAAAEPGFRVLLHADPSGPHRCGANPGVDPAHVLACADGLVLPCTGDAAAREAVLTPCAPYRREDTVLAANLTIVSGMGGRPRTLAEDAAHARSLGATELRLYHAGLASDADLAAVAEALRG
ncbi:hypothetical protein SRB5_24520 [Streptomyces sp. RB5]|uniref:Alanine-rich protein n=1 Tax=Streptomyces smaragdinus TaxID=2585196 RepID=A0A7K0CFR8_9ACTN|nr:hypothetical protein [Streptomyces smaragdinus]MQY12319.1 hypothetical protein [Streptomyces smaragdinus]